MLGNLISLLALACLIPTTVAAVLPVSNTKIVFLSPAIESSPFFQQTIRIMQAAAGSLNLDLEILYGNDDLFVIREHAQSLFSRVDPPDYLLLVNHRDITAEVIRGADEHGIHTLLFNGAFSADTFDQFRRGPKALENWIGQVLPDDEQSGRLVAQHLVEEARAANARDDNGKIQVVGINGAMRSAATAPRHNGLLSYVNEQEDVVLQQVVHADWNQTESRSKTKRLLQRYENTSVVWTAGDYLALGAAQAIADAGLRSGQDVFTAGVDCLPEIFEPIKSGTITGCAGGHLFDAAWAMVVIYDHLNKKTEHFVDERTQFYWSAKSNQSTMRTLAESACWNHIDFKAFSKTHTGDRPYDFRAELIIDAAKASLLIAPNLCRREKPSEKIIHTTQIVPTALHANQRVIGAALP